MQRMQVKCFGMVRYLKFLVHEGTSCLNLLENGKYSYMQESQDTVTIY
jgi:hypothetical protein